MYGREQKFFYKVLFSEESTLIAENFNDHLGGKSRILGMQIETQKILSSFFKYYFEDFKKVIASLSVQC